MDRKLIGSCGKFCGECEIWLAATGQGKSVAEVAQSLGVDPEKVRCGGCQGPDEERFPRDCRIIPCVVERHYRYCAQCKEINDCSKYAAVNAASHGKARLYSSQLRAWGEERWIRFRLSGEREEEQECQEKE